MTASNARRARFGVECLEGRAMMSATLAAPMPEPVELRYELENVLITSYQTSGSASGSHALYQDVSIPANNSGAGTHGTGGGGGAGKVVMQDIHFAVPAAEGRGGEIEIESYSWGALPAELPAVQKVREAAGRLEAGEGLEGMTDLAGVPVDAESGAALMTGYDLKAAKKV